MPTTTIPRTAALLAATALFAAAGADRGEAADHQATASPGDWAGSFVVRARVVGVIPSGNESFTPPVDTSISNAVIPELDITYFLTDNIAIETICCATPHTARLAGGADVGKVWLVPVTVTAQLHLPIGDRLKPYVGAGPHMSLIASDKAAGPFNSFKVKSPRFGFALQAGPT